MNDSDLALLWATKRNDVVEMKQMLGNGADPDAYSESMLLGVDDYDRIFCYTTPILLAAKNGSLEALKILVEHKAEMNFQDSLEQGVLYHLIRRHDLDCIKFCVENGLDVNQRHGGRLTALHSICTLVSGESGREHLKIAKYLLENGADVDSEDYYGITPFLDCFGKSSVNLDLVALFIEHGADASVKGDNGKGWKERLAVRVFDDASRQNLIDHVESIIENGILIQTIEQREPDERCLF